MKVNSLQIKSPNYTGTRFVLALNCARNLIAKPNSQIFDRNLKILGVATTALSLATIAINKKKEIPSWEELKKQLLKMEGNYGQERFSEYCIEKIELAYKKDPELTVRLVNLRQKEKWFINYGEDVLSIVNQYEKHPDFSEYVLEQIESGDNMLISFLKAESTAQAKLKHLFNYRDKSGRILLYGKAADLIIDFYKKDPDFCEKILNTKNSDGNYSWISTDVGNLINSYIKYPKETLELMDVEKDNGDKLEINNIKTLAVMEEDDRKFYIEVLKHSRLNFYSAADLYNSGISKDFILEMLNIKNFYGYNCIDNLTASFLRLFTLKQVEKYKEFFLQDIPLSRASAMAQSKEIEKIENLLDLGVPLRRIDEILKTSGKYEKVISEILENPGSMREFFNSENYFEKIKQNSAGKYQKELIKIFDKRTMPYAIKEQLFESDLTEEDFLESLRKISKSCFRLAYETPNQYLSDIDVKYSTLVDGHYPKLPEKELKEEQNEILKFFIDNYVAISRVLKYIDNDTFNHLMDKRTELFKVDLENLSNVPDDKLEILSKLLECKSKKTGKKLSPKEKLQICHIVAIFHKAGIKFDALEKAVKVGELNIQEFKAIIEVEVLKAVGIKVSKGTINNNKKLNEEYAYLTLRPAVVSAIPQSEKIEIIEQIYLQIDSWREDEEILEREILEIEQNLKNPNIDGIYGPKFRKLNEKALEMMRNIEEYTDEEIFENQWRIFEIETNMYSGKKELYTTIRMSILDDFKKYIMNPRNKYGKINEKTEQEFLKHGLDYKKWLNPEISEKKINISGKDLTLDLWERNPLEELFLGNKTTCCTAIGRTNGGAMPIYLLSTSWNIVELKDEKGDTVGMSRVFWADINGEPALMLDNIELNNKFNKGLNESEKKDVRDAIFKYMSEYARQVSGKNDTKIYFSTQATLVPVKDLKKVDLKADFIGKNPKPKVYVNSANCSWVNISELKDKKYRWFTVEM